MNTIPIGAFGVTRYSFSLNLVSTGIAQGVLLPILAPLSYWGGVDPSSGLITDMHHPNFGENVAGTVMLVKTSKGSTAASGALVELLHSNNRPAAMLTRGPDLVAQVSGKMLSYTGADPLPVGHLSCVNFDYLVSLNHTVTVNIQGAEMTLQSPSK